MTLEELKAEAKKQGYNLIKYNPLPKIKPCTCGRKKYFKRMYNIAWEGRERGENVAICCPDCGRMMWGVNEREARERWNKAVST